MRADALALKRYAYLLTGDEEAAEEVLQDSLVRVYQAWSRVRDHALARAYARKVIVRRVINASSRRREYPVADVPDRAHRESGVEERDRIWRALTALGPRQRAVVVLRFYDDLTEAAIADRLGVRVGTVKSQLSRGLATLRARLERDDDV